jgi:tetratricopeptide (TPR) repeat protein
VAKIHFQLHRGVSVGHTFHRKRMLQNLYRGRAFAGLGLSDAALESYATARAINPASSEAPALAGSEWMKQEKFERAVDSFSETLRLDPGSSPAHRQLADALERLQRSAEAQAHYREALKLDPDSAPARDGLAWLLATADDDRLRNGTEAVLVAERLAGSNPTNAAYQQTLSAAYAETGQFPQAAAAAEKALALATSQSRADLLPLTEALIGTIREKKPFRSNKGSPARR